jgi:hypothetical protein
MQCNIDQRGRKARIVTGVIVDAAGAILLITGALREDTALIIGGILTTLAGAFVIFEGVKGWCALRALGIKTPM